MEECFFDADYDLELIVLICTLRDFVTDFFLASCSENKFLIRGHFESMTTLVGQDGGSEVFCNGVVYYLCKTCEVEDIC